MREQLSDTLLSILAVRGGEIVQSIFGATHYANGHVENGSNRYSETNGDARTDGINGFA